MNKKNLLDKKIGLLLWKSSNLWQNSLRKILLNYSITLNEFIILETLFSNFEIEINQVGISKSSGVNISVVSTTLDILQKKQLIKKNTNLDNRKKIILLTDESYSLIEKILPIVYEAENNFFMKLGNDKIFFENSLKLLLGKKIRIKAEKNIYEN